jgi:uncharacterized protein
MSLETHETDLQGAIESIRLVDTHEHMCSEDMWTGDNVDLIAWLKGEGLIDWSDPHPDVLQDLFVNYASSDLETAGASKEAVERLLDPGAGDIESRFEGIRDAWEATQFTGYGEAVRMAASTLYGLESLSVDGIVAAQAKLDDFRKPGERLRLLRDGAGLDHIQVDDGKWACEPDRSGPEFFLYDISWWHFAKGEPNIEELQRDTGVEVNTLEDLRAAMASLFQRYAPFAIAVKSQHAYDRTLRWQERTDDDAARALSALLRGDDLDEAARLVLGDWCLACGVELAIQHDLPFKIHTGHHAGTGSMSIDWVRAGNLCSLLARYPEARFVLMHTAYPYTDELISIAKHYPNVWVDLCWAWSINPYSSADFVRRFLHAVPSNKLFAFGGDTLWPTQAVAYAIQARRGIRRALEAEVAAGELTEPEAIRIATRLMRDNQYACFDVDGTRETIRKGVSAE